MSKFLAAVVVLGAFAGAAYAFTRSPERAACMRVADLCGVEGGSMKDLDQCVDDVKRWRKIAGDEPVDKGLACVESAKTCGEAVGCTAGAAFKGTQNIMNDFFKGFGKAQ
jgi:hypothetical protein